MRSRPPFDLTQHLERLVSDLCARVPEFAHIDPQRLLLGVARSRTQTAGGAYAKIVPMRFPDGTPFKRTGGRCYVLPQIPTPAGEVLYLISIFVPRYFTLPFERRLLTLIHELYHIAPAFDGTIRQLRGRAHGPSRAGYNAALEPVLTRYLASAPADDLFTLVRADWTTLSRTYTLTGRALPPTRLIPLPPAG
jgi:hypothetical protein